jgi:hypothetical protein
MLIQEASGGGYRKISWANSFSAIGKQTHPFYAIDPTYHTHTKILYMPSDGIQEIDTDSNNTERICSNFIGDASGGRLCAK